MTFFFFLLSGGSNNGTFSFIVSFIWRDTCLDPANDSLSGRPLSMRLLCPAGKVCVEADAVIGRLVLMFVLIIAGNDLYVARELSCLDDIAVLNAVTL